MMNPEKVLPPGVNGKVRGHLTVKVDEVFWTRNSPGEVYVELLWWGEKDASVFRPEDITHNEKHEETESSVTYTIKTSAGLFQAYLKNCGKLTFTVVRGQNKNVVVGSTVIKDIDHVLFTENNYTSYYPVFSPKGKRLGDLHVCFELKFILKPPQVPSKHREENDIVQPKDFRSKYFLHSKPSSATSNQDQMLSDLFQKGNELRNAMVMSVLADCPTDKIDTVLNDEPKKTCPQKKEAKLVDFLLGKDMSVSEEMKALETLRCISPDENLIKITETTVQNSKCSKVSCCLHGDKCDNKGYSTSKSSSAPVTSEIHTPPSSIDQTDQDKNEKSEKKEPRNVINCYRLTVKSLILNSDGTRKICYAPVLNEIDRPQMKSHPPGTTFILDISLPNKNPWAKSLKFMTKKCKGKSVTFEQGTTHKLCGTVTWARVKNHVLGSVFTIYWRHLNQRVPCPLGTARIDSLIPRSEEDSILLTLPVYSNTRLLTGHLKVLINLGTSSKNGGEILYRHVETNPDPSPDEPVTSDSPELATLSSMRSTKPENVISSNQASIPISSSSSDYDDGKAVVGPSSLDEELLRTINLLNSKSANMDVNSKPLEPIIEKQEASIQTSLIASDCPSCGYTKDKYEHSSRERIDQKYLEDKNFRNDERLLNTASSRNERCPDFKNGLRDDFLAYLSSKEKQPKELHERRCYVKENCGHLIDNNENIGSIKIHEYNIKIEKVVGVPLFTGDKDMDCYVDYYFPRVDANDQINFDEVTMQTEVKMALRETEFKTIFRHRLRLGCKLTKAFLSLPNHDIVFRLWGRFYRPTPQDYCLGKVALPLTKLTALELKYEQQMEKRPIIEKFVFPIKVLESDATSGYNGPFGEMYINISYSNASSLSYREWRCKTKDDHLQTNCSCVCQMCPKLQKMTRENDNGMEKEHLYKLPYNGDIRNGTLHFERNPCSLNHYERNWKSKTNTFTGKPFTSVDDIKRDIYLREQDYLKKEDHFPAWKSSFSFASKSNDIPGNLAFRNYRYGESDSLNTREFVKKGYVVGLPKENESFLASVKHDEGMTYDKGGRVLHPSGGCSKEFEPVSSNKIDRNVQFSNLKDSGNSRENIDFGRRENVVEKVLMDLKERKERSEKKLKHKPEISLGDNKRSLTHSKDPFESFGLRVDLSGGGDVLDFEARSEYSFLKTPPPNETLANNDISDFESVSSTINPDLQHGKVSNPFTTQSSMSLSLNSDLSLFMEADHNNPNSELNKDNLKSNHQAREYEIDNIPQKPITNDQMKKKKVKKCEQTKPFNECILSSNETLESVVSIKSSSEEFQFLESNGVVINTALNNEKDVETSSKYDHFKARVEICRALGLPSLEVKHPDGKIDLVKPTSQAYFTALVDNKETVFNTPVIENKSAPIWNCSWDVFLPVELLKKCDREFEIFVDLKGNTGELPARTSDASMHWPIVLRTGVDLTPLTAGLENASGWFTLSDRALLPRAQIMVIVTPLEDISYCKKDWLKEYTKSKGGKMDALFVPERDSSLAASLQEKLSELDKLTQKMRNKMATRSKWDDSPPLSLLTDIQQEIDLHLVQRYASSEKKLETIEIPPSPTKASSIISISDDEARENNSVVVGNCEAVNVCSVNNSSSDEQPSTNGDSLETPSQTVDRILTRVRQNR